MKNDDSEDNYVGTWNFPMKRDDEFKELYEASLLKIKEKEDEILKLNKLVGMLTNLINGKT